MKKLSIVVILMSAVLSSCAAGPQIETLYVSDGIMQYFIYPTTLSNKDTKTSVDITFRSIKGKDNSVIVNFTYYYKELVFKDLKNAEFTVSGKSLPLFDLKVLFQEKRNHLIRYTAKMKQPDFLEMVKDSNPSFCIVTDVNTSIYPASGEFQDKLKELSYELF